MAYQFNGSNQVLRTTSTPVATLPLTISCWARIAGGGFYNLFGIDDTTFISYRLMTTTGSALRAVAASSDGNAAIALSTNTYSADTWFFAAGVFSTTSLRSVFLNTTKTVETSAYPIGAPSRIAIGATSDSAGGYTQYTNGQIAEPAIWNAALTDTEIASLAAGFTPDQIRPQSLQFYAPLVRDLQDVRGGLAITKNNSAIVAVHPRIIT